MDDFVREKAYSSHLLLNRLGIFLWDLRIERSMRKGAGVGAGGDWIHQGYLGPEQHLDFQLALEQKFKEVCLTWETDAHVCTTESWILPYSHKVLCCTASEYILMQVDQLIIVTPTPIVVTSARFNEFLSQFENDLFGSWEASRYRQERNHVLARIVKWASENASRSVH